MQAGIIEAEPKSELPSLTKKLYTLLKQNGAITFTQIADMLGIDSTQTYYLLRALQDKKLVTALPEAEIRFKALRSYV